MALTIVVLPFLIEKILYVFCKNKALERLIVFYTSKEKMKKDVMKKEEAKEVASTVLESDIRSGSLTF